MRAKRKENTNNKTADYDGSGLLIALTDNESEQNVKLTSNSLWQMKETVIEPRGSENRVLG